MQIIRNVGNLFQMGFIKISSMKKLSKAFTEHPESVGETYWQHLAMSFSFALPLLLSGVAALIHGVFPFLCVKTGSNTITRLYGRMVTNRSRASSQNY